MVTIGYHCPHLACFHDTAALFYLASNPASAASNFLTLNAGSNFNDSTLVRDVEMPDGQE